MVDEIERWKKGQRRRSGVQTAKLRACSLSTKKVGVRRCKYGLTTSVEPIPSNNIRRKKLYRQLTLMLNGGPLGAEVRKPLPTCCLGNQRYTPPLILLWATSPRIT
jgi:hypothetical protein